MRVLICLLMIVTMTALTVGAALVIGLQLRGAPGGLLIGASIAAPFLVIGPVLIGTFAGYFDRRSSLESRRYLGRWFVGVVAVDVVGAVVIVTASASAGAPAWVPVVIVGGAAVLFAVARPLGSLFRRTEAPLADAAPGHVPGPDVIRRKVSAIAVTFMVAAVVAAVGLALLVSLLGFRGADLAQVTLLAGQLTFSATAMAAIVVSLPITAALRATGGRDVGRLSRFAKVVLRGKDLPLDDAEARAAVDYARLVPLALQFQLAFAGLLYAAFGFQSVAELLRGALGVFPVVFLIAMVVILVLTASSTVRRVRRARRYVERHVTPVATPAA